MYESLRGKKLLVIGSSETDRCIVHAAQSMGVYVIAADGTKTSSNTKAKLAADEAWDIDYRETDCIAQMCREAHVDGVLAGYSENRVLAACRIAKALGTPFYATEEQIEATRDKRAFKQLCIDNGVRVPLEFSANGHPSAEELDRVRFPVIVKPSDNAGRKGITICQCRGELLPALELATENAYSGTVVIEEYLSGMEFAAIYTLQDGRYSLSYFCEKYLNEALPKSGLCDLSMAPNAHLKGYLDQCDASVRKLMRSLGLQNGVAFFQGIANKKGFWIFEMGYRLNGGNDCEQVEQCNGINYLKMLVAHSLTGNMEGDLSRDDPALSSYQGVLTLYARAGEIGSIEYRGDGDHPGVNEVNIFHVAGSAIPVEGSTLRRVFRFKLSAESKEAMAELIDYVEQHAHVTDTDGRDMLIGVFDSHRLTGRTDHR